MDVGFEIPLGLGIERPSVLWTGSIHNGPWMALNPRPLGYKRATFVAHPKPNRDFNPQKPQT